MISLVRIQHWLGLISLLCFFTFLSCQSGSGRLDDFSKDAWLEDPTGCKGYRLQQAPSLWKQREKLTGLSEQKIHQLIGKPNRTELQKRSQKFLIYTLESPEKCQANSEEKEKLLIIRLSALGSSNEVFLQNIRF